jgi:hypothetical protein
MHGGCIRLVPAYRVIVLGVLMININLCVVSLD